MHPFAGYNKWFFGSGTKNVVLDLCWSLKIMLFVKKTKGKCSVIPYFINPVLCTTTKRKFVL